MNVCCFVPDLRIAQDLSEGLDRYSGNSDLNRGLFLLLVCLYGFLFCFVLHYTKVTYLLLSLQSGVPAFLKDMQKACCNYSRRA